MADAARFQIEADAVFVAESPADALRELAAYFVHAAKQVEAKAEHFDNGGLLLLRGEIKVHRWLGAPSRS